jgi:tight adherence protein B
MAGILAIFCFVTLSMMGYALSDWAQRRVERRLEVVNRLRSMAGTETGGGMSSLLKDQRLSGIPLLDSLLSRAPLVAPLARMIQQAGLKRRAGEILLYIPLLFFIGILITLLAGQRLFIAVMVGLVLCMLPIFYVSRLRRRRTITFAEQLPEALDLVRSALQAGHGLMAAFQVVTETFADPVAMEFRYLVDEVKLGLPLRDALYNMGARVGDQNLPILIVGILTAQEVGGNMAEVIENITHTIREREKLFREVRVMTAQGRLSGLVLTVLPFGLALFFLTLEPSYFGPMLQSTIGIYMLVYALVSLLIGHFIIRRLVQIKV